nr:diguanylate cyclase [Angustibacter aerolatus]
MFPAAWLRALFGTNRGVVRYALLGVGALTTATLTWHLVPGHVGRTAFGPVLGVLPEYLLIVAVARYLGLGLIAREQSQPARRRAGAAGHPAARRHRPHGSARARLAHRGRGVCRDPGLRAAIVDADGAGLVVGGQAGDVDLPERVATAVLPVATGCGEPVPLPDVAWMPPAARALSWLAMAVPEQDERWMLLGAPGSVSGDAVVAVRSMLNQVALALRSSDRHRDLATQAHQDGLTGLTNRKTFDQPARPGGAFHPLAEPAVPRPRRLQAWSTTAWATPQATSLLRQVADRLRGAVRNHDVCARLGGDEFAVLLVESTEAGAAHKAERLVRLLSSPVQPARRSGPRRGERRRGPLDRGRRRRRPDAPRGRRDVRREGAGQEPRAGVHDRAAQQRAAGGVRAVGGRGGRDRRRAGALPAGAERRRALQRGRERAALAAPHPRSARGVGVPARRRPGRPRAPAADARAAHGGRPRAGAPAPHRTSRRGARAADRGPPDRPALRRPRARRRRRPRPRAAPPGARGHRVRRHRPAHRARDAAGAACRRRRPGPRRVRRRLRRPGHPAVAARRPAEGRPLLRRRLPRQRHRPLDRRRHDRHRPPARPRHRRRGRRARRAGSPSCTTSASTPARVRCTAAPPPPTTPSTGSTTTRPPRCSTACADAQREPAAPWLGSRTVPRRARRVTPPSARPKRTRLWNISSSSAAARTPASSTDGQRLRRCMRAASRRCRPSRTFRARR